jgi:hypothetical protein
MQGRQITRCAVIRKRCADRQRFPRRTLLERSPVSLHGRNRQKPSPLDKAHKSVAACKIALDLQIVPACSMPHVPNRKIEMLGPEERHRDVALAMAQHIEGGGLALSLGHYPMLDANPSTAVAIGPESDVAGGEDVRHAGDTR